MRNSTKNVKKNAKSSEWKTCAPRVYHPRIYHDGALPGVHGLLRRKDPGMSRLFLL